MSTHNEFGEVYETLRFYIKKFGKCINRAQSDWGADVYEIKGIKVAETDVGYGSQIYSDSFNYYGDYRSNPARYSVDAYTRFLDKKDEKKGFEILMKATEFIEDPITKDWKETLSDDFWLEKFINDYPASHIYD
jgi:hypothetical protein